ncbi:DUF2085 domain-containing protein [Chloroflexus sp.]|uniref:DUF2085 domain-containing protein n=1 Tax=Chloroflexus sp. TaxID=1904827 RepID=UPI002ACE960C|nr:DUF2085 domain-containing protein [Chloroflexus sp.]
MAPTTTVQRRLDWPGPLVGLGLIILFALLPTIATALDWERRLFFAMHGICAQSHNLISGGVQFPLCARDSGIYLGLMVTLGVMAALGRMRAGRLPPLPIGLTLIGLMAVMGIDGLNSTVAELGFPPAYPPRDDLRLVTGLGFGSALAVGLLLVANHTFLPPDLLAAEQAPIGSWRDLVIVIGAVGLVVAAIAANQAVLAWPLVLLSVIGVTGVMTFAVALPISAFAGLSGRVRHARQLALPGIAGFIVALLLLAVLAHWKIGLEVSGLLPPPLIPE